MSDTEEAGGFQAEERLAEQRLAELWRLTEGPARDLAFELGVEERVARRRMLIDVSNLCGAGVVGAAVLWAIGPGLVTTTTDLAASFDAAGPVLAVVAAIGAVMVWLNRRPDDAFEL